MDYEGLQIDPDSEVLRSDDGRTYRKVGRFSTMSALQSATEAVFTKSFCANNFYPHITENHLFREIDGVLCYSTEAGGIGGFYALPYNYTLKSEQADRITLTAACLGMDGQAYTFDLVLVKEDGDWKLDTYYSYTATGYIGDLPPLH